MRVIPVIALALAAVALGLLADANGQDKPGQDKPGQDKPGQDKPAPPQPEIKPLKALLVLGGGYHDYGKQKDILEKGIAARANVTVTVAYDPNKAETAIHPVFTKPDWAKGYDVVIHDECYAGLKDMTIINRILEPHKNGTPAVVLHCAMHCFRTDGWNKKDAKPTPWFELTGLATTGHGPQQPIEVSNVDKEHPILKGMGDWKTINEELYNNFTGKLLDTAKSLQKGKQGKSETVVTWTNLYNKKARVFGTTLGHNNATVADGRYLDLVTRGMLWAADKLGADGKPAPGYGPTTK